MSNLEDLMNNLVSMPEAQGLPEHFLKNILKIGVETSKISDAKWVKKMLKNAQKVHEQALLTKQTKKIKPRNIEEEFTKKELKIKKFKEQISQLPNFESAATTFPNISKTANYFIKKNYGSWTLQAMSVLQDTKSIYSYWAIQFAATLNKIGVSKILKVIQSNENLYEYVTTNELFKVCEAERNRIYNEMKQYEKEIINAKKERKKKLKESTK